MAEPEEEATPDESGPGSNPARSQQGDPTGAEPNDRELQVIEDADGGHGDVGVAVDGDVVAQVDGSSQSGDGDSAAQLIVSGQYFRSAPLPEPSEFAAYEQVLPGAADRIIRMAENAQAAAIEDAHTAAKAEARSFRYASFGVSFFPWLLAFATIALVIVGQNTAAVWTAMGTIGTAGPQIVAAVRPPKREKPQASIDKQ